MKNFKYAAVTALVLAAVYGTIQAARVVYSQTLVSETALAYTTTYSLDMGASYLSHSNVDSLSMQAVYSSATISAVTFIDGTKSTATITVSSYPALLGARATNTLTVKSTTTIVNLNVSFTLNGIPFYYADLWSVGSSSAATAINICSAINSYGATMNTFSCSTTSAGVATITAVSTGTLANSYTLATSSNAALQIGTNTFTGGLNQGFIVINGVTLTQGTDFNALTSSATTATNIAAAINANQNLSSVIIATAPFLSGVVYATSTSVGSGTNYSLWASTVALSIPNRRFYGGTDSNVVSNVITKAGHSLTTGLPVLYTTSAGTAPQNLIAGTTYYPIRVDSSNFKLATSLTNAQAGTAITISTVTGSGTFVLTPLGLTGTPSFKWQGSNDNSNWADLSVSSVTMSSLAPASTLWDFGTVNYRYVRLNVVGPTTGGINLVVTGNGKSSH